MTEQTDNGPTRSLQPRYEDALAASGLVDDVIDIMALDPRPFRYTEGDFVCRHGDAPESLWVIVAGSVSVRDDSRTLFVRHPYDVVGEQNLLGNGHRRWYDLVASENQVELLEISRIAIEQHARSDILWRNIAKIISLKLKDASIKTSMLSGQLEDDTAILHAYTNEYALSRRLQSGAGQQTGYHVDRAVVWFSDVVDFSRYVFELKPSQTADVVQSFFNAQSGPITAHGGHIDKFVGDGLMAFWVIENASDASASCIEALRAAEESVAAVSNISIGENQLQVRIGLHTGLVLSGDFGSTTRHQFTLIGPEVNKAARLEQVHSEDIVDGETDVGAIRLSAEFRGELSDLTRQQYSRRSTAKAKNIGEVELYS
jgi:class 3 adenylate cyclase